MVSPAQEVSRIRAIAAFALGTLVFAYAFTQRVAPSVMTVELMRDFSAGAAAVGGLSAWYFYTYASIQLPVGMLTDRFGPRRLISAAMAVCAVASLAFSMSESLAAASLSRALVGATVGFGFVGILAIAGYWFPPQRFAFLAGMVQTAGMLGGMAGQAPLRLAVDRMGWRGTMTGLSAIALALAVMVWFVVPRRPQREAARPSDATQTASEPVGDIRSVLKNPQSWYCNAVGFGLASVMLGFVGLWSVPWLTTVRGMPGQEAAAVTSFLFLGWALGAPSWGWISDHLGRRKPMVLLGILANLLLFTAIVHGGVESKFWLSILFFAGGIAGSSMTVMFGAMRELNRPAVAGSALGLLNMCIVGAGAVTQPLAGWLLDRNWDGVLSGGARIYSASAYDTAFLVFYAANALALAGALLLRETYCGQVVE
jgi:sugar phosphate permease